MKQALFFLSGLWIFSALLRGACLFYDPTVSVDGMRYLDWCEQWIHTANFVYPEDWQPPLPIFFMRCLTVFSLTAEQAGVVMNFVFGCFVPLIACGIAREVVQSRKIAAVSGIFMAVIPSMVHLSCEVQRDMIYLFFSSLVIWMVCAGIRRKRWYFWGIAGLFLPLALLSRYEAIEFLPLLLAAAVTVVLCRSISWRNACLYLLCLFAAAAFSAVGSLCVMGSQKQILRSYELYYRGKLQSMVRFLQPKPEAGK